MVFEHSAAKGLFEPEALRNLVSVDYEEMLDEDNNFDLELVWEILEEQSGFEPETVKAPLCLFKTFEPHLDMTIKLPEAMADMTASQVSIGASDVKIPAVEMKRVLRGTDSGTDLKPAKAVIEFVEEPTAGAEAAPTRRQLPGFLLPVAGLIAFVAFSFTAFSAYKSCAGPKADWKNVSADALGDLPAKDPKRFGAQVTATLTDDKWLTLAEATRKSQLANALEKMRVDGVRVLALRDSAGRVRATVQISTKTNRLGYSFIAAP